MLFAASDRYLPSVHTYFDILSNSNLLWTLVFVMVCQRVSVVRLLHSTI